MVVLNAGRIILSGAARRSREELDSAQGGVMAWEVSEVVSEVANRRSEPVVRAMASGAGWPPTAVEDHTAGNGFGSSSAQPATRFQ